MCHSRPLFFISYFQCSWQYMFNIIFCRWLDSNRGPLESAVTALPTEPQPLPVFDWLFNCFAGSDEDLWSRRNSLQRNFRVYLYFFCKNLKMRLARKKFLGKGSWKDPEKIGLYLAICFVYMIGLLAFFKTTGTCTCLPTLDYTGCIFHQYVNPGIQGDSFCRCGRKSAVWPDLAKF